MRRSASHADALLYPGRWQRFAGYGWWCDKVELTHIYFPLFRSWPLHATFITLHSCVCVRFLWWFYNAPSVQVLFWHQRGMYEGTIKQNISENGSWNRADKGVSAWSDGLKTHCWVPQGTRNQRWGCCFSMLQEERLHRMSSPLRLIFLVQSVGFCKHLWCHGQSLILKSPWLWFRPYWYLQKFYAIFTFKDSRITIFWIDSGYRNNLQPVIWWSILLNWIMPIMLYCRMHHFLYYTFQSFLEISRTHWKYFFSCTRDHFRRIFCIQHCTIIEIES